MKMTKNEERKIMIIGAGGIGSYLAQFLKRMNQAQRINVPETHLYDITVFDGDTVDTKNLGYQAYDELDVGEKKVECIGGINPQPFNVLLDKQLHGYDLVVCCADNLAVRRLLYRQGFGSDAKLKWLDLRSTGRNAALISYKVDPKMMDTLLIGEEGSFSCQAQSWDGSAKDINCMNMVIAGMGVQWIQRWFNDNEDVTDMKMVNL
tara:strand:+ start:2968 stop:3585 length:618 start_codon:yes stop_codon:yes gene_type:complete